MGWAAWAPAGWAGGFGALAVRRVLRAGRARRRRRVRGLVRHRRPGCGRACGWRGRDRVRAAPRRAVAGGGEEAGAASPRGRVASVGCGARRGGLRVRRRRDVGGDDRRLRGADADQQRRRAGRARADARGETAEPGEEALRRRGRERRRRDGGKAAVVADEASDRSGVELRPGLAREHVERALVAGRAAVGAVGGDRVEGVGDGDDAGAERDLLAGEPVRIALPVEPLVVVADHRGDRRVAEARGHRGAVTGVAADRPRTPPRSAGRAC